MREVSTALATIPYNTRSHKPRAFDVDYAESLAYRKALMDNEVIYDCQMQPMS